MFQTKKYFSLMALTLALVASLTGCGEDNPSGSGGGNGAAARAYDRFQDLSLSDPEFPIVGIWNYKESNPLLEMKVRIDRENITIKVKCEGLGRKVEAQEESPIELGANVMNIRENIKIDKWDGNLHCEAMVPRGEWSYEVDDQILAVFKVVELGGQFIQRSDFGTLERISKPHQD